MPNLAVANQYAKALLEAVSQPDSGIHPEEALAQLEQFSAILKESRDLRGILLSPAVAHGSKTAVLTRLGDMVGMHGLVKNFLFVVTRHRRLGLMPEIRDRYQALLDEAEGLVRAGVAAAQPLSPDQTAAVESMLARMTGRRVRCGYTVDESLVGGVTVRIGSTMYDGSVRGQLDGLRRRLTRES
jgi:F-type H+-transporting ATPase subunit delta